jgi:glycosyltransferase involved in cell wall biosynthesis
MSPENVILIYRRQILALSETFIREQVLAYQRWRPILVGHELGPLPVDDLDVRLLGPQQGGLPIRILRKLGLMRRDDITTIAQSPLRFARRHAVRQLKQEHAALLHAHFGVDAVMAWPLAKELGLPMVVTLHGYDIRIHREWWEQGHGGDMMRGYPAQLLALANQQNVHFVAVSDSIRERAVQFGIPAERIWTRYIGIDTRKFAPGGLPISKRERRVLFVGRLVEVKGCRYLIEAMARVQKSVRDALLIILGDGPLRPELEAQARRLSVNVRFRGAQPSGEVKRELDLARVFCLPSITTAKGESEGFPTVLQEAQAAGLPVVTSASSGAHEGMEDGGTGFAFAEGDVATLAERLTDLLTDDELAGRVASRAPSFIAEHFDIRSCTESLELLYDDLVMGWTCGA